MLERTSNISESPLSAGYSHKTIRRATILPEGHLFNKDQHLHHSSTPKGDVPHTEQLLGHVDLDFHNTKLKKPQFESEYSPQMVCNDDFCSQSVAMMDVIHMQMGYQKGSEFSALFFNCFRAGDFSLT